MNDLIERLRACPERGRNTIEAADKLEAQAQYIRQLEDANTPEIVALRARVAGPMGCAWTQDPDFEMGSTYHSACGEAWSFIDGGPAQNRMRYCHWCGKPVKQIKEPK